MAPTAAFAINTQSPEIGCYFSNLDDFRDLRPHDGMHCASVDQILERYNKRYVSQNPDLAKTVADRKRAMDTLKVASGIKEKIVISLFENATPRFVSPLLEQINAGGLTAETIEMRFRRIRLDFSYTETEMLRGVIFLLHHELEIADHWGPAFSAVPIIAQELAKLQSKSTPSLAAHYQMIQANIADFEKRLDLRVLVRQTSPLGLYVPRVVAGADPDKNLEFAELVAFSKRLDEKRACGDFGPDGNAAWTAEALALQKLIESARQGQSELTARLSEALKISESIHAGAAGMDTVKALAGANATGLDATRASNQQIQLSLRQLDFDIKRLQDISTTPGDEASDLIAAIGLTPGLTFQQAYDAMAEKICKQH
jgi:hypothetical protein